MGPACALHLLLTLSERFSIALWTNPPRPLVGDAGRSKRSGERRPCEGDIASAGAIDEFSPIDELVLDGGSNLWLLIVGKGDPMPPPGANDAELEYLWSNRDSPRIEPSLGGDVARPKSEAELARFSRSVVCSLDIPGNGLLPINGAVFDESSWFLLNAADPTPRSCVCLNQAGSFDPKDCEIWLLDMLPSAAGVRSAATRGEVEALFSEANMDNGRLLGPVDPRDEGRCCHERVPAREGGIAVLGEGVEII